MLMPIWSGRKYLHICQKACVFDFIWYNDQLWILYDVPKLGFLLC